MPVWVKCDRETRRMVIYHHYTGGNETRHNQLQGDKIHVSVRKRSHVVWDFLNDVANRREIQNRAHANAFTVVPSFCCDKQLTRQANN
jgi:hypothetical protein